MSSFNFNKFIGYEDPRFKKNSFNKVKEEHDLVTEALKMPLSPGTRKRLTAEELELARLLNEKFELLLKKEEHKKRKEEILGKFPSPESQKRTIQKYYQQKLKEEILSRFPSPETQKRVIENFRKEQEAKQRKALEALRKANSLTAKSLAEFSKVLASSSVKKHKLSKKSKKGGALRRKSRKVKKSRKN